MVAIYAPRGHEIDGDGADRDGAEPGSSRWFEPEAARTPSVRSDAAGLAVVQAGGQLSVVAPGGVARRRRRGLPPQSGARPVAPAVRSERVPRRLPDRATRVRRRRLAVVVGLVLVAATIAGGVRVLASVASVPPSPQPAPLGDSPGAPPTPTPVAGHTYVVRPGDTLWSIASTLAPDRDPRPVVDALRKANGGPNLEVGDRLMLVID